MCILLIVPNIPTDFTTTGQFDTLNSTTITFGWTPPQGNGVKSVVDNYSFFITPTPLSHPNLTVVYGESINVTLEYNTYYNASILAINCAGESALVYLLEVEFSKLETYVSMTSSNTTASYS